jgi:hypothetical protein
VALEGRAQVAEAQRQRRLAELADGEPGHRHRPLAHHRQHPAVPVRELEQPSQPLRFDSQLQRREQFHRRRLDEFVSPGHKGAQHPVFEGPPPPRGAGQQVGKAGNARRQAIGYRRGWLFHCCFTVVFVTLA